MPYSCLLVRWGWRLVITAEPEWVWLCCWLHLTPLLSVVCLAVWRNHHMRTVTNYFIVNLSLADVLVTAICLPASLLVDITESWLFGHALCKVIPYLQVRSSLYYNCLKNKQTNQTTTLASLSNLKACLSGKSQWIRTLAGSSRPPSWTLNPTYSHRHLLLVTGTNLARCAHTQLPPGTQAHAERRQELSVTDPNTHWVCSPTPGGLERVKWNSVLSSLLPYYWAPGCPDGISGIGEGWPEAAMTSQ